MIHPNSLAAYQADGFKLGKRAMEIYALLRDKGPMTDRQVVYAFGKSDLNYARPRLTDLIHDDWVVECGETKCGTTGKVVRLVRALSSEERAAQITKREAAIDRIQPQELGLVFEEA